MKSGSNKFIKYQSGNVILKSTQVLGALILGDCNSAMDKKIQKQHKIQTIISIGQQAMPVKQKLPENCKHFFYDIHDNKSQKVSAQLFDEISNLIQKGRQNGSGVLVHCYAGVSRSSTFVIAYIMQKFLKSYDEAKQEVKNARNYIYPNDGFVIHLKHYQKVLQQRQQQRLRKAEEQKNRLMNESLVRSARKIIRGGVRGATLPLSKVPNLNQQQKAQKSYEFIIEPIIVSQQQLKTSKQQQQKTNSIAKIKNSLEQILSCNRNKLKEKVRSSKKQKMFLEKSISTTKKLKQQVKLPKVNQTSHSERVKRDELVQIERVDKQREVDKVNKRQQRSQLLKKPQNKGLRINHQESSKLSTQSKQPNQSVTMGYSKSFTNRKRYINSIIDESILNDHERKIKRIYQSKMSIK